MFQNTVLGLVVVSFVLQCQGQQQRFVELPFDDSEPTQQRFPNQEPIPALPQGFGQSPTQSFVQNPSLRDVSNHGFSGFNPVPSNNPTPTTIPPHTFNSAGSSFPDSRFTDFNVRRTPQQIRGSARHVPAASDAPLHIFRATPAVQGNPPSQGFQFRQPPRNQFAQFGTTQPIGTPSRSSFVNQDAQLLDSVSQPQAPISPPANTFIGIEEPALRSAHPVHIQRPQQRTPIFRAPQPVHVPQTPQPSSFIPQPQFVPNEQPRFENVQRPVVHQPQRFASLQSDLQSRNQDDLEEKIFRQQAENAKYSFASHIDDSISGNQHQREETRDGLTVRGKYSYNDGYVTRTVSYEADDKGYRVIKEEEEPVGNGPQVNPNGQANVSTFVSGNSLQYSITGADIQDQQKKLAAQSQTQPPFRSFGGRS